MHHGKMYGTTSIGERGQVVIPSEAREELQIEAGEKFVVFGSKQKGAVILVKAEKFNKMASIYLAKSKEFEALAKNFMDENELSED